MPETEKLNERMEDVADAAERKASRVADETIDRLKRTAERKAEKGQQRAGRFIGAIGAAVEAGSSSFDADGYHSIAGYGRSAAKMIRTLSEEAENFETAKIVDDAEALVRRNPVVTYGALALAGFALAAFLRRQGGNGEFHGRAK
jgi:ElaB/YqjD/DUF883 family membrane-anchored ribosome-binding protein